MEIFNIICFSIFLGEIGVHVSQPMFTLVLVLGVSVLDVLEYLIGENAKYLYLYLITST